MLLGLLYQFIFVFILQVNFYNSQRNDLEDELQRLRKDVDDATMVRVDLERKIETLREELEYNRKVHGEEMEDLKEQIASQVQSLFIILYLKIFLDAMWSFKILIKFNQLIMEYFNESIKISSKHSRTL